MGKRYIHVCCFVYALVEDCRAGWCSSCTTQLEFLSGLHQGHAYSCGVVGLHAVHFQIRLEASMHAEPTRQSSAVNVLPSCTLPARLLLWLVPAIGQMPAVYADLTNTRNTRLCAHCLLMIAGSQRPHIGRDRGLPCRSQPR